MRFSILKMLADILHTHLVRVRRISLILFLYVKAGTSQQFTGWGKPESSQGNPWVSIQRYDQYFNLTAFVLPSSMDVTHKRCSPTPSTLLACTNILSTHCTVKL